MRQYVALVLVPLTACTIATSDATADNPARLPATCQNEALARFTGQVASEDLGTQMLRASGARLIRWVPQGGVVTMEYNAERITVLLDGSNRVERASCG